MRRPPVARAALAHGALLIAAGSWRLAKARVIGASMVNAGVALSAAGLRGRVSRELRLFGIGTALTLAALDGRAAALHRRGRTAFLATAAGQLACAALWGFALIREARERVRPPEPAFA